MSKRPGANLSVIPDAPGHHLPQPSCKLGKIGKSLWDDILGAYEFADRASYETLSQVCAAADRAEELRELIDHDGPVVRLKGGAVRDHPCLKHELACRAFVCRSLQRLGLDLEPVRDGPGRPPGFS